jgi:hypothetical protein
MIWYCKIPIFGSRDSSVGTATGYGLDSRGFGVRVLLGARISPLHVIQIGYGAHPSSYPTGTKDSFPEGKAARA